jgi:hypothetical protein
VLRQPKCRKMSVAYWIFDRQKFEFNQCRCRWFLANGQLVHQLPKGIGSRWQHDNQIVYPQLPEMLAYANKSRGLVNVINGIIISLTFSKQSRVHCT